jgi:Tol biopolymer transport system component/DNA-binding winged helix-turn-helix (wHTH) protein
MTSSTGPVMLKFGPYLVDLSTGEIRKNGTRIRLQEKSLRVLAMLIERPGQLVGRDELRKRLWPEDTFVDFETGLNTAVSKLRDALCDSAEKSRYIETIPRRGYRFAVPVEFVRPDQEQSAASVANPVERTATLPPVVAPSAETEAVKADGVSDEIERIRASRLGWIRGTIVCAAVVLVSAIWWLTPLPNPSLSDIFLVTQTGRLDFQVRPATDGARLFYVQRNQDHYDLAQASVNGGDEQLLEAPFPNTLIWDVSPDGTKYLITSFVQRGEPAPLWIWSATGGRPVRVGDIISGSATFSPDGKKIVYHIGHDLLTANIDGTEGRKLASFENDEPDSPVWSPDGGKIRFNRNNAIRDTHEIWEIGVDGANAHPILPGWEASPKQFGGTWSPDGRYFLFSDGPMPGARLYTLREEGPWWRRHPRGPFLLASEASGAWSPLVGRNGKTVYFYASHEMSDLQSLDVGTKQFSTLLREKHPAMLSVSRDGQFVAYVHAETGLLWTSRIDGSSSLQIPTPGVRVSFPRLSPDNREIVFTALKFGAPYDVEVISASGGVARSILPDSSGMGDPDWSPDGTALVMERTLPLPATGGKGQTSTLALVNLKTSRITNIDGSADMHLARWSPDGRYIAAVSSDRGELLLFDIASNHWSRLAEGKTISYPVWSFDSRQVFYQDVRSPGQPVLSVSPEGKTPTVVTSFDNLQNGTWRCVFVGLSSPGNPLIAFTRGVADIHAGRLSLP